MRTSGVDLGVPGVDAVRRNVRAQHDGSNPPTRRNVRAQHDGSPRPPGEMCVPSTTSLPPAGRNVRAQHDGSPAPHDEMCVLKLFSCLFLVYEKKQRPAPPVKKQKER